MVTQDFMKLIAGSAHAERTLSAINSESEKRPNTNKKEKWYNRIALNGTQPKESYVFMVETIFPSLLGSVTAAGTTTLRSIHRKKVSGTHN